MKASDAGILLLSNGALMAGVLAEALPPDSIPIQCATICGPIVELSSICSGSRGRGGGNGGSILARRRNPMNQDLHVAADRRDKVARVPHDGANVVERDFTVIVPAPTSFPASLLQPEETASPPQQSKLTRIYPTQVLPTQKSQSNTPPSSPPPPPPPPPLPPPSSTSLRPPPPPPTASPASSQQHPSPSTPTGNGDEEGEGPTTRPTTGTSATPTTSHRPRSSMDAMTDDDGDDGWEETGSDQGTNGGNVTKPDQDQGRWTANSGEEDCVCQNKSFNVPNIAALCASCIAGANQVQNDMDVIMTTCKFTTKQYSPDQDKLVNNIQVHAVPPKAVLGQNAGVASGEATSLMPTREVQIVVGAALGLLQLWLL
ncbi:hypothetical protein IF1G_07011 [Cordyceps javanica]|uniref:Uncharacterized protein n=1 Tax=Cordyceps javanica TaxID=43265 RepID=A0A545UXD6_9HYPO|nr:hypothetical protein IF1G_07011 [Cordyceps javanica]TQW06010.1 hypothetical protein IF2G_06293 [Cordyceps javanica]